MKDNMQLGGRPAVLTHVNEAPLKSCFGSTQQMTYAEIQSNKCDNCYYLRKCEDHSESIEEARMRNITQNGNDGLHYSPTAQLLLNKAAEIMTERAKQYDKPDGERSMGKCVEAFNTITGRGVTEAEGWLLLQILKDVRLWQKEGYHADSAEDCIAYAALKAEAKAKEI